jgi:hypothetical protein
VTDLGIVRRDDNATTVTCDACPDGHVEEVVRVESPPGSPVRAYIPCPQLGRVAVPLDRLKQWGVDLDGLANAVAQGLRSIGEVDELVPARLWSLGTITAAGKGPRTSPRPGGRHRRRSSVGSRGRSARGS